MSNSSIRAIDRTLSGATTQVQNKPSSDANKRVLRIPQSSSITGDSPSDYLVSYSGHTLRGGVLPFCRGAIGVFYSPSRLGHRTLVWGWFLPLCRDAVSVFYCPSRLCQVNSSITNSNLAGVMVTFRLDLKNDTDLR